MFEQVGTSRNR